jgi:mRNA-degrading endonuclease toxin of MazEF toxin-antitoxin module
MRVILIYHVDLNPMRGHEQAGARYVLVVTTQVFNDLGTPVVCPITQAGAFARHRGFAVKLADSGTHVTGIVLCKQLRPVDLQARSARFVEKAPADIVDEVLARIAPLFD